MGHRYPLLSLLAGLLATVDYIDVIRLSVFADRSQCSYMTKTHLSSQHGSNMSVNVRKRTFGHVRPLKIQISLSIRTF